MKKPLILVTNDDGIHAVGIRALVNLMKKIGNVLVVAPETAMSGQSNAITVKTPLSLVKIFEDESLVEYATNGTPTDCVKLALNQILNQKPDLLVSGINHGSNSSVNVFYSGTMGAVFEGCINEIPSIGFSHEEMNPQADISEIYPYVEKIVGNVLTNSLPKNTCLNVNFPKQGKIKGIKVCKQADAHWTQEFEKETDGEGKECLWLAGYMNNREPHCFDTDEWALKNDFISIVPCKIDITDYFFIDDLKNRIESKL